MDEVCSFLYFVGVLVIQGLCSYVCPYVLFVAYQEANEPVAPE